MKDFNEILNLFLVEIEKNPNNDVDDLIREKAANMQDKDMKLSANILSDIESSLSCIDDISHKISDLKKKRNNGYTREEWFLNQIEKKLSVIPRLSKEQKERILSSIYRSVKETLKNQ